MPGVGNDDVVRLRPGAGQLIRGAQQFHSRLAAECRRARRDRRHVFSLIVVQLPNGESASGEQRPLLEETENNRQYAAMVVRNTIRGEDDVGDSWPREVWVLSVGAPKEARPSIIERLARSLGASADEICFTSGGTEADNLAVIGAWRALRKTRPAVVSTPIEHKAVLAAVHEIEEEGGTARLVDVTSEGVVDKASFDAVLGDDVALCSVMWVNNEIGTVQDIPTFAAAAKARGALFHTDGVQALGKVAIDLKVAAKDPAALRPKIEDLLSRSRLEFSMRTISNEEIEYEVQVPIDRKTDRLSNAILKLDPAHARKS